LSRPPRRTSASACLQQAGRDFINTLIQRGLQYEQGLLVVIDGAKGFYAAVTKALSGYVAIQRCQWHKRENVTSYLAKNQQDEVRKALQDAYELEGYKEARAALHALRPSLALMNESALGSLEEGLEETLTIHRLGLMPFLKKSFRTTNCIESLNSMVEQLTDNVKRWTNSNQRCRWLGTALLDIQPRLRRVNGYRYLPLLRQALQKKLKIQPEISYPLSAD
jgi:transposase-like protein